MTRDYIEEIKKRLEEIGAEIMRTNIQNKVGSSDDIQNAKIYFRKKGSLASQWMELSVIDSGIFLPVFEVKKGFWVFIQPTMNEALEKAKELMDITIRE